MLCFVSVSCTEGGFLKWLIQSSQDTPRVAVTQQKVRSADSTPPRAPHEANQLNSKRTRAGPNTRSSGSSGRRSARWKRGEAVFLKQRREHRALGRLTWRGGSDELLVGSNSTALCLYLLSGSVALLQTVCLCCAILSLKNVSWRLIGGRSCTQNQKRPAVGVCCSDLGHALIMQEAETSCFIRGLR